MGTHLGLVTILLDVLFGTLESNLAGCLLALALGNQTHVLGFLLTLLCLAALQNGFRHHIGSHCDRFALGRSLLLLGFVLLLGFDSLGLGRGR